METHTEPSFPYIGLLNTMANHKSTHRPCPYLREAPFGQFAKTVKIDKFSEEPAHVNGDCAPGSTSTLSAGMTSPVTGVCVALCLFSSFMCLTVLYLQAQYTALAPRK